MFLQPTGSDPVIDAASALLAAHEAGLIVVPPRIGQYQRGEIERELRVDSELLHDLDGDGQRTVALGVVCNVRRGLATGAMVAVVDVVPYVAATIEPVAAALGAAKVVPMVWFDAPTDVAE